MRSLIVFLVLTFLLLPFSLDPRIKRIKQQEKEAREAKKRGTAPAGPAVKTKKEEEEEKIKAELEAKQKEEEEKVCILYIHFRFPRFDLQFCLSLLVLRLRNKKLRLLTQQRKLEGSNAQRKELRWILDTRSYCYYYITIVYAHVMLKCSLAVSLTSIVQE
jgi:hypothetical protein